MAATSPPRHRSGTANPSYVRVKVPELVAVPPCVVIVVFPLTAPVGTVAVAWVSEFTVKLFAATLPNLICLVCLRLMPLMATSVPIGSLVE